MSTAHSANIDSLQFVIRFNPEKQEKLKAYKDLSMGLIFNDFEECRAKANSGCELAEKLFLNERTIETHHKKNFRNTNTSSVIGLVKYAHDHNLI